MLKDCLEVFEKVLKEKGEGIILDSYVPKDGTYIIVSTDNDEFKVLEPFEIKIDKKSNEQIYDTQYKKLCELDSNSVLVDMNKPVGNKKIHSNNYLSFFVKKESLEKKDLQKEESRKSDDKEKSFLTVDMIDDYYNKFINLEKTYTSKEDKMLYNFVVEEIGDVNKERVEKIREWVKDNIFNLERYGVDVSNKGYVKIFFDYGIDEFIKEGRRYLIPKIYNSNDFNMLIKDEVYGLPNDNLGMNSKKPYLKNRTRKVELPYILDIENVQLQKKFFDYLMNMTSQNKNNVYIDTEKCTINSYRDGEQEVDTDFSGIFLRLWKEKNEAEICSFDVISCYTNKLATEFNFQDILMEENPKYPATFEYKKYTKKSEIHNIVNEVIFSKYLKSNYFTECKDLSSKMSSTVRENILFYRDILFDWFYKNIDNGIEKAIYKMCDNVIIDSIQNDYIKKASQQFNLKMSFEDYFKGGNGMADIHIEVIEKIREKINLDENCKIDDDVEYCFAVGQAINYLLSLSKAKKRPTSMINPFLNCKNTQRVGELLSKLYNKYNYTIYSKRFDRLYAMILGYEADKIQRDWIECGFLSQSLIYEKKEKGGN